MSSAPRPRSLTPRLARFGALCAVSALLSLAAFAQPQTVYPVRQGPWSRSLNGEWHFKYVAGAGDEADANFFEPAFDSAAWKPIPVPSHWELEGFAEPKYGKNLAAGTGYYRTTFRTPADWDGRRVFLLFDGVLYGFDAWVNGVKVGSWASGYNPVTFDVTDALKPGGDNVLAVRVTTRSEGWEFDTNDCWSLSGIYRDVTLFATPPLHFRDFTASTTLQPGGGAQLHLDVQAEGGAASSDAAVSGRLVSPDGATVREFRVPLANGTGATTVLVDHPALWTAETPSLYALQLTLEAGGKELQRIDTRVGLRQVTIEDGVFELNGRPVKLRGVDHHDLAPDVGRALTEERMRQDLDLIKAGNMNFIRTSHYPPEPRLIELCDELGIYVMCEVPFGFGDEHLTDPSYQDILLTRARATVGRDKNHPSILVWSVGNENPNTPLTFATGREVKRLDPTRPICFPQVGSYFGRTYPQLPDFVDVYAPHYPVPSTLRSYATKLTRPIIVTEYAHELGLASDLVQDAWEIMQQNPRYAGGAVWMFQDQGILRTSEKPYDRADPTHYVWVDSRHYYDTSDLDGVDGIVYSDRTPQVDYWEVRKVYSPVQLAERSATVHPGAQTVALHLENRFDFRSLEGIRLLWTLEKNGRPAAEGVTPLHAPPHGHEEVAIGVTLPESLGDDVYALALRCVDETGRSFYERGLRLDPGAAPARAAQLAAALAPGALAVSDAGGEIRVVQDRFELRLDRTTGRLTLRDRSGRELVRGLYPHAGRKFTMAEELRAKTTPIWPGAVVETARHVQVDVEQGAAGVRLTVHASYPRPDAPEQALDGSWSLLVTPRGTIDVSYAFSTEHVTGTFLEAGLALVLPPESGEFRWIGQGPFAGYPGKDRLNEFGLFHLGRKDIRFQGNRREVELAVLSTPTGRGIALAGDRQDVAVENDPSGLVLSQNALLAGRGNKGGSPEVTLRAAAVERIAGNFTLIPLTDGWLPELTRWFGQPSVPAELQHPFYQSYDQ